MNENSLPKIATVTMLFLDLVSVLLPNVAGVDDRAMIVAVAQRLGLRRMHHTAYGSTRLELGNLGLSIS